MGVGLQMTVQGACVFVCVFKNGIVRFPLHLEYDYKANEL